MWKPGGWIWIPQQGAPVEPRWIDLDTNAQIWKPRVGEKSCWPQRKTVTEA
jgi:hypothetical protein